MTTIFDARRRPISLDLPAYPAPLSSADIAVKTAYGLSLTDWNALSDEERAEKRLNVATAQKEATQ